MAKVEIPRRLVRDIERSLQDRINEVKGNVAEHFEQCRTALREVAATFGVDEAELFTLAEVPAPPEKPKRPAKKPVSKKKVVKKKVVVKKPAAKKSMVKKPGAGTAEQQVAAILQSNPAATGSEISKVTGYATKTVYNTRAWKKRPLPPQPK
jgi:hypothetical protein